MRIRYAFAHAGGIEALNSMGPRTSGTAIASLVFGVLSWCVLPFIGAILAVIFGHSARNEIRRSPPGTIEGDGMALAGLILGWAHLALFIGFVLFVFMFLGGLAFLAHFGH
jgi:thiol:disulfide interchange protein